MSDLTFVQGDTGPSIKGALKKADASVFSLVGVTAVKFQMKKDGDRRYTVNAAADIVDSVNGKVQYDWAANDLDVPGEYIAQWELTFADGKIQTTQPPNTVTVRRE